MRIPDNKVNVFKSSARYSGAEHRFIDKMASANIPVVYWLLPMSQFNGSAEVKEATFSYVAKLSENYAAGKGVVFAGSYGVGKTYALCSILKSALVLGYSAYYTSISDMSFYISSKDKGDYWRLCMRSDFLVFDEMDSRHVSRTEASASFFGSSAEKIIRERVQNKLPTLFATNHNSIAPVFTGQHEKAIMSLIAPCTTTIQALGRDYRKKDG